MPVLGFSHIAKSYLYGRLIEESKLSIDVNVTMNGCLSIHALRLTGSPASRPQSAGIVSSTPTVPVGISGMENRWIVSPKISFVMNTPHLWSFVILYVVKNRDSKRNLNVFQ